MPNEEDKNIVMMGGPHPLFVGLSRVTPGDGACRNPPPLKEFGVYYVDQPIVGFHVVGSEQGDVE